MKTSTRARRTDPQSSHDAGHAIEPKANTQKAIALAAVRQRPGATSAEIAKATGLSRHDAARRLPELRRVGLVSNGKPRTCKVTGMRESLTWLAIGTAAHLLTPADIDAVYRAFERKAPTGPEIAHNLSAARANRRGDIELDRKCERS